MSELVAGEEEYRNAQDLFVQGQYEKAEKLLRQGLTADPTHHWCNSLLGMILMGTGRLEDAEQYLREAAVLSELTDPGIVRNYVLYLVDKKKDLETAQDTIERAIKIQASRGQAAPNMMNQIVYGYVLENQGKTRSARAQYLEALRSPIGARATNPSEVSYWWSVAQSRFVQTTIEYWAAEASARVMPKCPSRLQRGLLWLTGAVLVVVATCGRVDDWFHISDQMQIALVAIAVLLVLVPYVLNHPRLCKLEFSVQGFKLETKEPRPAFETQSGYRYQA